MINLISENFIHLLPIIGYCLLLFVPLLLGVVIVLYADRKIWAAVQKRRGPNVVGPFGIFQIPQDLSRQKTFEDDAITNKKERTKIFGQYDHVRVYGRDYFDKLRSVGFKVDEIEYSQKITSKELDRFCLMKNEILPVCYKK